MTRLRQTFTIPALVLAIILPVMLLTSVAHSQLTRLHPPEVQLRQFGDADRAIDRIRAKLIDVNELDRRAQDPTRTPEDRLALAHAPLLLETPGMFSGFGYTPIGLYYTISSSELGESKATTITYYLYFTGEPGGTSLPLRLARYGRPFDGEMLYYVTLLGDRVLSAVYQAPVHQLVPIRLNGVQHPIFRIASENNNFQLVTEPRGRVITLLPQNELAAGPYDDPDFLALAANQTLRYDGVDISRYVYLKFYCPDYHGPVDVSVRVKDHWYHLHDTISDGLLGESVTVPGYYQTAIALPFVPQPADVQELRIVTREHRPTDLTVLDLYVYSQPRLIS